MAKKIDLSMNPFEGDFGEGEEVLSHTVTCTPKCHHCGKRLLSGKIVRLVEGKPNYDEEEVNDVTVHYWHERCWVSLP